jgi:hypothetical protein
MVSGKTTSCPEAGAVMPQWQSPTDLNSYRNSYDYLCGLVVRVPGYRFRGPRFDSRRYQIFSEVVGIEQGPFSLVSTVEELLGRNSSGSGLESREYRHRDLLG